jgi:lysophospholipase L1-like esterase
MRAVRLIVGIVFAIIFSTTADAGSAAETCLSVNEDLTLGAPLPRTAAVFKSNGPLTIVAIGSSSTVGLWMVNPAATYPEVMKRELVRLNPAAQIKIVNSGRNGDTIPGNVARFERDVFAHKPDLVVWQLGSNDLTWAESIDSLKKKIIDGVEALRTTGADVILMDQQYTPVILATQYSKMQSAIASVALQNRVAFFPRFELMHKTVQSGVTIGALSSLDGLHMSSDGYDCIGRALARAITTAARR